MLFIDLEGQYKATIDHVEEMFKHEGIRPWWVCLPINLRNASSLQEPYWCAWEPGKENDWVRPMPACKYPSFSSTHFLRFPVSQPSADILPASGYSGIHEAAHCCIHSASVP